MRKLNLFKRIRIKMRKWINRNDIRTKSISAMKWVLKELFIGLVVGIAVVIATSYMQEQERYNRLKDELSTVHIGESYEYIKSKFGVPVINMSDGERNDIYYKFEDAVLRCVFEDDELIAYMITVKDRNLYKVRENIHMDKSVSLLQFYYTDFSVNCGEISWNVPENNDDYAYYQEVFYGAGPEDYNYYVVGSYKDYRKESIYHELLGWCNRNLVENPEKADMVELQRFREILQPNTYGMIKSGYENEIEIISFDENMRNYGSILFDDWSN